MLVNVFFAEQRLVDKRSGATTQTNNKNNTKQQNKKNKKNQTDKYIKKTTIHPPVQLRYKPESEIPPHMSETKKKQKTQTIASNHNKRNKKKI